ncbi:MAG: hypothetical protein LBB22_05695 [Treponema sp.]|jgi:hypothetical protein|nr:hypothetical protein [Treponema sp.]
MKRRFLSKIAGLLFLYFCLFVLVSLVQFTEHDSFSKQIGALHVDGRLKRPQTASEEERSAANQGYLLEDGARAVFGGLEFWLAGKSGGGLTYINLDGSTVESYPESVSFSNDEARFRLSGGQELVFYVNNEAGMKELMLSALISGGVKEILVPFRSGGKSKFYRNELGDLSVTYGGENYTFEASSIDEDAGIISLSSTEPVVFYRIVPVGDTFNLTEYITAGAMEKSLYNEQVTRWRNTAFTNWESRISSGNLNENVIVAYLAEAAGRGTLRSAFDMLPAGYARSENRTFLSAPFAGRLNSYLREFVMFERNRMSRITSYTQTDPAAFLAEERVFEYLARRGNEELFNTGIDYISKLNPASIDLDLCAGIFEGWLTWSKWRGNDENPFEALIPKARSVVVTHIKKDRANAGIFVIDETVDVLYNIRLGAALIAYGEEANNNGWSAMGRSIALSVLSLFGEDSSVSAHLVLSEAGSFVPSPQANSLTSAEIYAGLGISDFYPHAFGEGQANNGVWLWTVSPEISASLQNSILDFGITFPIGEAHYVYIFNVQPFSKIQLRNIDYRSDPQFEQYNAPGWLYSAGEKVLMVKILQQSSVEHIRIAY